MVNVRRDQVINDEELFFLRFLDITNDTNSSCCSSITSIEDTTERLYETTVCWVDQMATSFNSVIPQEKQWKKERERAHMHQTGSELANYIGSTRRKNAVSESEEEVLSHIKQVRWADALVDVHTYISPKSHVLWNKLRKKVAKAAVSLIQDIEF